MVPINGPTYLPMITRALEPRRSVVTGSWLAELWHNGALINGAGLIGHRVDILAGPFTAQCHVFGGPTCRARFARGTPSTPNRTATQVFGLWRAYSVRAMLCIWIPLYVALPLADIHTLLWKGRLAALRM